MEQLRESQHDAARLLGRVEVRMFTSTSQHKIGGVPIAVMRDTSAPGKQEKLPAFPSIY